MGSARVEWANEEHAQALALTMRPEDAAEVMASHGMAPLEALTMCMELSRGCWALLVGDEVIAMWGVSPMHVGCDNAWLLTGVGVERHRKTFWKESQAAVERMLETVPTVYAEIDARHTRAIRWATRLGFYIHPARPSGVDGKLFHPVAITRGSIWAQ